MSISHQLFKEIVKEKKRKVLARIKDLLWKSPDHADPHPYGNEPLHGLPTIGGQQHRLPATENVTSGAFAAGVNSAGVGKAETDTDQTISKSYLHTSQGQRDVLDKLKNHFTPSINGKSGNRHSFLLYGMGGSGKTQVCLKFIDEMIFSNVFWVDASSKDTIIMSLKGVSRNPAACSAGVDGSVNSVLLWMAYLEGEWLLVFDNADGAPQVVEEPTPSGSKGHILITSRNKALGRLTAWNIHEMAGWFFNPDWALLC
ncbi:hypothetical protein BYT27DRAFT_7207479 [Phlegmacium glaucopus]|nr:hypothetical protein BYT27DRAFT_7207479 [Phlegmacium glaucopus]